MTDFLLKSTFSMAVLLGIYYLLLEREKMHHFNRFYLLGSLAVSFIIPFITIPVYVELTASPVQHAISAPDSATAATAPEVNYWPYVFWTVYILGLLLLVIRFALNIYSFRKKAAAGITMEYEGAKLVLINDKILPHTFLYYIFVNEEEYKEGKIENELYTHELVHVKQKHTLDILFAEALKTIFWFNPLVYCYKSAIQLNHEFLADEVVVKETNNTAYYQELLLQTASADYSPSLASSLNFSLTKKRFTMMTKSTNRTKAIILQLLSLPTLTVLIFLLCTETRAQVKSEKKNSATTTTTKSSKHQERRDAYYSGVHVLIDDKVNNKFIDRPYEKLSETEKDRYGLFAPEPNGKNSHYPGKIFKMVITAEYEDDKVLTLPKPLNTDMKVQAEADIRNEQDKQPQFSEGSFMTYVLKQFKVPDIKENIDVKVYVSFVVETDGSLSDIKIMRDPGHGIGDEIKRVVKESPKWHPAIIDGQPTRMSYTLPIRIMVKN